MVNRIAVDVTTFISAEDYLLSQNKASPTVPSDPFAQQCYAELVQSLIYFDEVVVPHPVKLNPDPSDFGEHPRILRHLFDLGIAVPMRSNSVEERLLRRFEASAVEDLKMFGVDTLIKFIDKTRRADEMVEELGGGQPMMAKLAAWADFQADSVKNEHHHGKRIPFDGIEDDPFGQWARASAFAMEGQFRILADSSDKRLWLIATLIRALRYSVRAQAHRVPYTPHPLRRDFTVMFELSGDRVATSTVEAVISAVRGIPDELLRNADHRRGRSVQLLEYELPLLGGRLWTLGERGRFSDARWLQLICGRIDEYRGRALDFRIALSACNTEEEARRLEFDIEGVRDGLLEHLGLRAVERNETEAGLVESVASIADASGVGGGAAVPATRLVRLAWRGIRRQSRAFETPHQKFLYREFVRGIGHYR